ncbi:GNAT superfamily N-acetyltransferase [Bacillus tianshenii]|uniref:GNAT superfamily N-acetyltransferase n=1 Tax=Sutcliffiella tianshenii TaxID=1463404 RepID=A0ABS2P474_9BACI|nr:GNAT family N-acetyltransferase [Bacillus tianshenii]MBM7621185.1 GNAT superfamily N-acetyltransferase [Bacillus tianshenii]
MILRDAMPNEIPSIRQQRLEAYHEYAPLLPEAHWEALKKSILSEADMQPGVEIIVAESEAEGKILGSVVLFPPNIKAYEGFGDVLEHSEIRMLAVSPSSRGKGVASTLVNECIIRTKDKGYPAIGLHTGEFMEGALQLYTRFGFLHTPEHDFEPANDGIIVKAFKMTL